MPNEIVASDFLQMRCRTAPLQALGGTAGRDPCQAIGQGPVLARKGSHGMAVSTDMGSR